MFKYVLLDGITSSWNTILFSIRALAYLVVLGLLWTTLDLFMRVDSAQQTLSAFRWKMLCRMYFHA